MAQIIYCRWSTSLACERSYHVRRLQSDRSLRKSKWLVNLPEFSNFWSLKSAPPRKSVKPENVCIYCILWTTEDYAEWSVLCGFYNFIRCPRFDIQFDTGWAGAWPWAVSATGEYKPWTKHGRNMDDPWINVSITGCAYRAELILGRLFTYCMRMRVL